MNNTTVEPDFPRGNPQREPTEAKRPIKRKDDQLLLNGVKSRKKKKVEKDEFELNIAPTALQLAKYFNYNTLRDGAVVLGCIDNITDLSLQIALPNLVYCSVKINLISDHLTDVITKQAIDGGVIETYTILTEIFKLGQLVPVKIRNIVKNDTGHHIDGSLNPRDVNEGRLHHSLVKGATIWANIVSELDHGYELSAGIQNCRIFLPFKNIDDNRKYRIGEPLFCIIHKHQFVDNVTTLSVSAKREHLTKCQLDNIDLNILIPGTKVEFFIEELQENGVKGKVFATYDGFIDKNYQFGLKKHFKEGKTIWAYVVFIETITGVVYLTLRGLDLIPVGELEVGKTLTASVASLSSKGVYLKFDDDNHKGFVTNRRILNLIKQNDVDYKNFIKTKYRVGSKHKCRILSFNRMEQIYICTVEPNVLKEKVFTINDLRIGEQYTVTIEQKVDKGLVVSLGRIRGFIPNLHLSSSQYVDHIKEKFKEHQQVNARLLSVADVQHVLFTIKQELVESANCLTDINDAVLNQEYVGYVVQTKPTGVLVGFYNNIKGWISREELNFGNIKSYNNPEEYFFNGQIVHVWVLSKNDDRLKLSVTSQAARKAKMFVIGQKYQGEIIDKQSTKLTVSVGDENILAVLPSQHLSRHCKLSELLYELYKNGDKIYKSLCINNRIPPILSRREYQAVSGDKNEYKQFKFEELQENMLIRVAVKKQAKNGILVSLPVKDYNKSIYIPSRSLFVEAKNFANLRTDQCILAKIMKINHETKEIALGTRPKQLDFRNIDYSIKLLISYIKDVELIQKLRESSTQYKVATKVGCIVKQILTDKSIVVQLPDGTTGIVLPHLYPDKIKINSKAEGIILAYNVVDNNYYVSLRKVDRLKINPEQDASIEKPLNSYVLVKILLITEFYVLGLLKDTKCNNQLIYLPVDFNENDKYLKLLYNKEQMKILLVKKYKGKLLGVPKKFALLVERSIGGKVAKPSQLENAEEEIATEIKLEDEEEVVEVTNPENRENPDKIEIKEEILSDDDEDDANVAPILSSIDKFYVAEEPKLEDTINDEDVQEKPTKPTVTLSKADWKRQEEQRIRKIEQELADPTTTPQTAEQFERLLLANPNSVELWLKYIATLVSATELNKARAVGEQALEKIAPTMVEEKMQIWIALLNVENLYGIKENFDELFERAIKYNETFDIYIKVIKMLANSGKMIEMEEKIRKLRTKEKQNVQMWLEIGQIYYNLNKYREARNVQEAALKSITDKKRQFEIILRFGIMEFQYGELEHAVQHFETILDIYSKKINMWIVYIDQLIKKKEYEMARKVLDRAIRQKFPVKNMRTLYHKFISFEEQFGNEENVQKIKQMAKEYVDKVSHKT